MKKSVGRFNLRSRKSLKLTGQIECNSCKRNFFPIDFSKDNENIGQINCCDCEEKEQNVTHPKRRTTIKIEKEDSPPSTNTDESNSDGSSDLSQDSVLRMNAPVRKNFLRSSRIVKIHTADLLKHPMEISNDKSKSPLIF